MQGWHVIQDVHLPCRRHQRAVWLLCVKAHLKTAWALAAHILASEATPCSHHVAFAPATGACLALPIFSMPLAGPESGLKASCKISSAAVQVKNYQLPNLMAFYPRATDTGSECAMYDLHYLPSSLCTGVSRSRLRSLGLSLSLSLSLSRGLSLQDDTCCIMRQTKSGSLLLAIQQC